MLWVEAETGKDALEGVEGRNHEAKSDYRHEQAQSS